MPPEEEWLPIMRDLSNKPYLSVADLTEVEREAHRLRAAAVADMLRGLARGVVRLVERLTHHSGTPAHG